MHGHVHVLDEAVRPADMGALQLRPLVALALSFPAFMYRQVELSRADRPQSISAFLARWWTSPDFGVPNELVVDARTWAMDQGFVGWCAGQGVEVVVATGNAIKSIVSLNAAVQNDVAVGVWIANRGNAAPSLADANTSLHQHVSGKNRYGAAARDMMRGKAHADFVARASNETALLQAPPLASDWSAGSFEQKPSSIPALERFSSRHDLPPPWLPDLLACWPERLGTVAKELGTTAKNLRWFAAGKARPDFATNRLYERLGVQFGRDDAYLASGVFLDGAAPAASLRAVYGFLTGGGDLEYSFEATLPRASLEDGRFLIFSRWGGQPNVIWFGPEIAAAAQKMLGGHHFMNRTAAREVQETLAQDLRLLKNQFLREEPMIWVGDFLFDRHRRFFEDRSREPSW